MHFKKWLIENNWQNWPNRKGVGDDPTRLDTYPERINGDYIFYHGTDLVNAIKIINEKKIGKDNWGMAGINTTSSNASTYASIKASSTKNPSVVLKLIIDKNWFESQEIHRETGGNGKDSWLINGEIPSSAIKNISIEKIRGEKDWAIDYPDLIKYMEADINLGGLEPPREYPIFTAMNTYSVKNIYDPIIKGSYKRFKNKKKNKLS